MGCVLTQTHGGRLTAALSTGNPMVLLLPLVLRLGLLRLSLQQNLLPLVLRVVLRLVFLVLQLGLLPRWNLLSLNL